MSELKAGAPAARSRLGMIVLPLSLIGVGALAQPATFVDGKRFWAPYAEIADMFDKFNSIPAKDRSLLDLKLALKTTGSAMPAQKLQFSLAPPKGGSQFGVTPDGYMAFPQSSALRKANPPIYVNLPAQNRVIIYIVSRYAGDVAAPVPAGKLVEFVNQARGAVASQGGMFGFFMPKPDSIRLRAGVNPGRVTVKYKNGRAVTSEVNATGQGVIISTADLNANVSNISVDRNVNIEAYSKKPLSVTVDSEAT